MGLVAALLVLSCTTEKEIHIVYPEYGEDASTTPFTAVSCDNPYFTATDDGGEVSFKTKGGKVVINVASQLSWMAQSDDADWLVVEADCDLGTLTITAEQNTKTEVNTATIMLYIPITNSEFAFIHVTQNACGTPEIAASENTWNAPAVGELTGEVTIETSFDEWSVETSCTWLLVEKLDYAVRFTVDPNEETDPRSTEVILSCGSGADADSDVILVTQDGRAYISLSSGALTFFENAEAKVSSTTVESNYDWDFSYDTSNGWFSITREGDTLIATVSGENTAGDTREGEVIITAGDGLANMTESSLRVTQLGMYGASLVLGYTVNANSTVQLPLAGTVDCTVDWGDTSSETVTSTYPTHVYENAGEYVVTITGTVTALDHNKVTSSRRKFLTEIVQWGMTGLTTLDYAFYYCVGLESVPADEQGAFSDVTSATYMFCYAGSGNTTNPSAATGLAHVSPDLFQYAEKCTSFAYAFQYCYNLQEIPEGLFRNCKSATSFKYAFNYNVNIDSLPEDLFAGCPEVTDMSYAFSYCVSLPTVPADLFAHCPKIKDMGYCFRNCSGLMEMPKGVFDNLTECTNFQYLFYSCSDLVQIPTGLFFYNTASESFSNCFYGCSSLTEIPIGLFDSMAACTTLEACFQSCTNLTTIPGDLFKDMSACTTIKSLFYGCSSLAEIPEGLFDKLPVCTNMGGVFRETPITTVPANLFQYCSSVTDIQDLFYNCESLTDIPDGLFDGFTNVTNMTRVFYMCTSLERVPADLLKKNLALTNANEILRYDEKLTEIPEGFFTANVLLESMDYAFNNSGLTSIPDDFLPTASTTLKSMKYTFSFCLGLTEIPDGKFAGKLPHAESLTVANLFTSCSNLKRIGDRAFYDNDYVTTISGAFQNCTALESIGESAFEGCAALKTISGFTSCTALKSVGKRAFAACGGASASVNKIFQNFTALEEVGEELFADCTTLTDASYVFDGCSSLKSVPGNIFDNCPSVTTVAYSFRNTGLTSIPESLFNGLTGLATATYIFYGCTGLTEIPSGLFANNESITTVSYVFNGCTGLTAIPAGLFDNNTLVKTFSYAFKGCSGITGESPYSLIDGVKVHLYERSDYPDYFTAPTSTTQCFNGCTQMSDYDSLPSGWY